MATFKDRYEELFGPLDEPDAPEIRDLAAGGKSRALDMQAAYADESSPKQAISMRPFPAGGGSGDQGALTGLMKGNAALLGKAVVGVPKYALNQIARGPEQAGYDMFKGGADALGGVQDSLMDWRQGVRDRMNPDVLDKVGREWTTLDPDKTIWQGSPLEVGEALMYKLVEQVPMTLATLVPGGVMMRAGMGAKAISYLSASEAGLSVGFIADDIADGIKEMTDEQLVSESPRFAELLQQYGTEDARQMFTGEAQGMAPVIGGLMVAAVSATAGRYLEPVINKAGAGLGRRVSTGAISEGLVQEGPQESIEQIVQNVARAAFDGDVQALDGVVEAYVGGAAVGGPMGGVFAGLAGNAPATEEVDDGTATPVERDVPGAPSSFTDVFGDQAPSKDGYTGALPLGQQDMFAEQEVAGPPQSKISTEVGDEQIDPAIRAAIQANIVRDDKMDDMFVQQDQIDAQQTGIDNQLAAGRPVGQPLETQDEMFPTAAPTQGPGVPIASSEFPAERAADPNAPEQQDLLPPGDRVVDRNRPRSAPAAPLPDELDNPSREPVRDIDAQIEAMDRGEREGVYLSAANLEGLTIDLGERVVEENFDDKGGLVIFADQGAANSALEAKRRGMSMQQILGAITGSGDGKSMSPDAVVVQQLDETGSVVRESQVANEAEAEKVAAEWGDNTQILSQEDAIARRESMIAREQQPDLPIFSEPEPEASPQQDMFQPDVEVTEQVSERKERTTQGHYRVRFLDDVWDVIEDKSFPTYKGANTFANKLAKDYELTRAEFNARVQVTPIRALPRRVKTEKASKPAPKKTQRAAPAKTAGDKAADKIRKTVPIEERGDLVSAVAPAKTRTEAAENIEAMTVARLRVERKKSIGGFFTPESYTFNSSTHEQSYRELWNRLVQLTLDVEVAREIGSENLGTVVSKANRDMAKIKKSLAKIRQIDKPRRVAAQFIAVAKKLAPDRTTGAAQSTQKFDERGGVFGEDESQPITASATPSVEDQLADVEQSAPSELKREAALTAAEVDTSDAIGELDASMEREAVDALEGFELDVAFEQALNYRRQRGASIEKINALIAQNDKKKVILRAITSKINQSLTDTRAEGGRLVTHASQLRTVKSKEIDGFVEPSAYHFDSPKAGKAYARLWDGLALLKERDVKARAALRTLDNKKKLTKKEVQRKLDIAQSLHDSKATEASLKKSLRESIKDNDPQLAPTRGTSAAQSSRSMSALTSRNVKADESKEDKAIRLERSRKAYRLLRAAAKEQSKRWEAMQNEIVERDGEGTLTEDGRNLLFGREGLGTLLQLARSVLALKHNDTAALSLAEGLTKLLARDYTHAELAGLHQAQIKEVPVAGGYVHGLEGVVKDNATLMTNIRRRQRMEMHGKDSVYRTMVGPVLRQMSESVQSGQGFYRPSVEEMHGLKWALDEWKKSPKWHQKIFYTPLRKMLQGSGFEFNEDGTLRIAIDTNPDLTPRTVFSQFGGAAQAFDEGVLQRQQETALVDAYDENAQRNADNHVKGVSILARFRKVVDHSRVTIGGMIDAEFKMLEALEAAGFIKYQGSDLATISIPGLPAITFRKSAYKLRDKTTTRDKAKGFHRSINLKYTVPKAVFAVRAAADAGNITAAENPDYEIGFFLKQLDIPTNGPATRAAASALGDVMLGNSADQTTGEVTAVQALAAMEQHLNPKSVHGVALQKLLHGGHNFSGVKVKWGTNAQILEGGDTSAGNMEGALGKFFPSENTLFLNADRMRKRTADGNEYLSASVVHTLLHEVLHAATHNEIRNNPALRAALIRLRGQMVKAYPDTGMYGLNPDLAIDEFVVEMFSNWRLQALAKSIRTTETAPTPTSFRGRVSNAFKQFKAMLARAFGFESDVERSVFDVVMEMETTLFKNAGAEAVVPNAAALNFDGGVVSKLGRQVLNKVDMGMDIENRVRDSLRNKQGSFGGGRLSHAVHTMEQLRDRYKAYMPPLKSYVDAFFARNSRNAQLMNEIEYLSRDWSKLHGKDVKDSVALSQIGTESTLYQVNPTQSLSHDTNKHITSDSMKKKHAELAARYKALSTDAKTLWSNLQNYYSDSLERETSLMRLNALRGIVDMDEAAFNKKYNRKNIAQFKTKEDIEKEFGSVLPKNRPDIITLIQKLGQVPEMERGVYFPLMRYGDYAVFAETIIEEKSFPDAESARKFFHKREADDPTLSVSINKNVVTVSEKEFATAETLSEADKLKAGMVERYGAGSVRDISRKHAIQSEAAIGSNAALTSILTTLKDNPAAQAAIKAFYLRSLAETSFRKREIKRKNRRGVDYDLQHRNFANYSKQSAYYTAQLEFGGKMGEAIQGMKTFLNERSEASLPNEPSTLQLRNALASILQRDEMSRDPQQVSKFLRGNIGLTQFYMLTSASYHMINASQPWMVTAPVMSARHGWGATLSAMKNAQALIKQPLTKEIVASWGGVKALKNQEAAEQAFNVFEQLKAHLIDRAGPKANAYIAMLEKLRDMHVLEVSPLTELREIGQGIEGKLSSKVLDASRIMAHIVEVNNRVLTAISAYDLELAKTGDAEAALTYASEMVSQTQFNYSSANKPPLFQKWPLMFQFMQWTQHMYALLIRNAVGSFRGASKAERKQARKTLIGLLGTHAAVGGATGMMLQPIKMAIGLVALGFSDEDDPITGATALSGKFFDREVERILAELFGTTASTVLAKGLPTLAGVDLSDRMSMGTLYFVDLRTENAESMLGSMAASFGGAWLSLWANAYDGLGNIASGDVQRGLEKMVPKFARDISKAQRFLTEGLVNNAGDTVVDTSKMGYWDAAMQAIGFGPLSQSQFYAGQSAMKDTERFVKARKSALLKEYRNATSGAERSAIRKEIRAYNKRYRLEMIDVNSLKTTKKSKSLRERQYDRYGASIDRKKIRQYSEYGEPYR